MMEQVSLQIKVSPKTDNVGETQANNVQIKLSPKTEPVDDEANNLLGNGILVETSKGLICMSLNDALSLDLNLSEDDLRSVAAELISQQNVTSTSRLISSSLNCDSDGFSSECSDISTTTSGSSIQPTFLTLSSLSNEKQSNVLNYDCHLQNIINRPKRVSTVERIGSGSSIIIAERTEGPNTVIELSQGIEVPTVSSEKSDILIEPSKQIPFINKTIIEVNKKKGRGGWPKGRKRKPELLNLPPKAPATGYTLYLNEQRKLFKHSNLAFHEITKIIGNKWSSLTLEEKKPYLEKAEEDKKRYREELKQYRQSDAYRSYLLKKRKKRLQNNVLSESDMDATDDFDEEDNEELYCRTCDQWFHNLHNKREHLQGKQHLQSVAGDMTRELNSDVEGVATTSTVSFSTSLDESSLDGMPNVKKPEESSACLSSVSGAMSNLTALVKKRETEIKVLRNRHYEAVSQQQALCNQLYLLNERHKKLQKDLDRLKENEKGVENLVFHLWQVPSWFIINNVNMDSTTDVNESTE